ncbi:MAG TPA: thioredoxin domain-containing protein [Candidatus Polarisedimenticolaceae bacterium]|nr:thioredoxin domain-containing protein [Candidatus Polarisedimenticolaceae bacterium]
MKTPPYRWIVASLFAVALGATLALTADAPAVQPKPAAAAAPAAAPAAAAAAAAQTGPFPPEKMDSLDFGGLNDGQKKSATDILNDNGCDCGCGMKVAECRVKDAKCGRSKALGQQVIDLVKQGKSKDEIVKNVLTPPTKFVQFDMPPGDAPAIGPAKAPVTVVHYFDYQCPFCLRVVPTLEQIVQTYPKEVRLVYKMHPLSMHPNAMPAAEAAMAAAAQGKFFEMNKKLFQNQQQLNRDTFIQYAKEIGLDVDKFTKDIDGKVYEAKITAQGNEADGIGANGTPATFINGRYVNGAKPFGSFKEVIDEEIGWAKSGKRPDFKTGKNVAETQVKQPGSQGPDPNKVYDLAAGNSPSRGPSNAKVTILHFFDYQCPFCVRVAPTIEQLAKDYPNDVRVVYKMHPLPMHPNAMIAAEAAMAANAQGKFLPMAEKLYVDAAQPGLSRDKVIEIAKAINLDVDKFTKDLDTHAYQSMIAADTKQAMDVGATGTPSTFVNGRFLSGAQPIESFKKVIDEEIAKAKK